jgi:hypothetical protein
MDERVALIERERRKLNWLRQKVEEQARRVQALEAMQDDPLDEMFERDTAGAPSTAPADQVRQERVSQTDRSTEQPAQRTTTTAFPTGTYASWQRLPKRLPPHWVHLFEFIGREGKTSAEVLEFIKSREFKISGEAVRTALMNYRREFGLVENPRRGFYQMTEKGMEFVQAHKEESPADSNSEAFEPPPTPLTTAAA